MPQGVFRLRSAVLSAHLSCLSILQTVLPPTALSRFRGTDHSDRIQTLSALPPSVRFQPRRKFPRRFKPVHPKSGFPGTRSI